jgi:hypothetical protein
VVERKIVVMSVSNHVKHRRWVPDAIEVNDELYAVREKIS